MTISASYSRKVCKVGEKRVQRRLEKESHQRQAKDPNAPINNGFFV